MIEGENVRVKVACLAAGIEEFIRKQGITVQLEALSQEFIAFGITTARDLSETITEIYRRWPMIDRLYMAYPVPGKEQIHIVLSELWRLSQKARVD